MDSVVLSTPLPSPDPSRSRLCMICGVSRNENHVYIVDVVIDESSLGDNHKIPPRVIPAPLDANAPDIDLSAYLEMTPNIVLVDFPLIKACALGSVLYFFPQSPSTDVLSLELPRVGTSLNQHRVVYGEDGGMLKKAPLNLLAPKHFPIAIRYGTRVLVFSTKIPIGLSGAGHHHFEIYHPCSEPEPPLNLKELPDLVILRGSSYDGFELYNIETKSSSEPFSSNAGRFEINLYIHSYSLVEHIFVVRSTFGMFCLDLENPKVRGWERYFLGGRIIVDSISSARQVYVTQNHEMAMVGFDVYKDREDDLCNVLPRSFIPIPFNKHTRYFSHVMMLDSFKYPRCTPCIIQTQCDSEAGCSYMIMDVVRIDLSKLRLEEYEEWAEIIHSFKFRMKHKRSRMYYCYAMFPI